MNDYPTYTKWIRLVLAAAVATSLGVAINAGGSHAALDYDSDSDPTTLEELTRFQIDGDRNPALISNSGVTLAPGVTGDWDSTPYGPQPIGSDPTQPAPAGIGSAGLLPLLFADIKSDDFPTASASPSPNPAFGLPGEPEFCVPDNEDAWVGGEKVQDVSIDNPLFNVDGDQALQCAQVLSKGDLFSVYAAYETVAVPNVYGDPNAGSQNHVILYGAWERGEVPGELNFYIPVADAVPGNSAGDRLIAFDYDSSAPASYRILGWDGANWIILESGSAAVNGTEFAAAVGFADGSPFNAGGNQPSFGEFALDLTATGILPTDDGVCVELTTAGYVFTETGNSANAQLKDYVGAPKIPIGNCGPFSVTKAGPADVSPSPLFDYRVEQQDSERIFETAPATTPGSTVNQLNSQFVIDETQVRTQAFAEPDYFAFEEPEFISGSAPAALPTGWDMISVECTYIDAFSGYTPITEVLWENGARTTDVNGDLKVFQVQSNAFLTLTGNDGFVPNCIITNDAAGIIVEKQTDPDGAATLFPFELAAVGGTQSTSLADGESAFFAFDQGNDVTVTELIGSVNDDPAWSATDITCRNEDGTVAATGDPGTGAVTVTSDDTTNTITCTFTNTQDSELTLIKEVVNDNGGTAVFTDWTLSASGPTPISGAGGASDVVDAGTYTLSESGGPADYTASAWSCVGGTQAGDQITLAAGNVATCTITNDDDAPSLTLVKEVTNDNGGTAVPGDWTLTAAGYDSASPDAGTYDLSESGPAGYTQTSLTCDNAAGQVTSATLALGEDVTCTFVNDDDAPSLTLVKEVTNDNGGTAVPGDWTLTAAGYDSVSPDAGTYDLSESGPAGYTQTSLTCDNAAGQVTSATLGLGEDVTCTFVNDDDAPSLTLTKVVVNNNGGTAVATDFVLSADGPTPISGAGGAASDATFDAGTYDLSETSVAGYTAGAWSCTGGTQNGAQITVGLGESASCTIVNDDDGPGLTLTKIVVNDNGGTAVETDFVLTADGPTPISGAGGAASDATFEAGTYDLSETSVAGYTAGAWDCTGGTQNGAQITLGLGESASCTITNDDDAPSLTLIKEVVNDNGGTAVPGDWTLTAAGYDPVSPDAGTYDLSENGPTDYTQTSLTCDNAAGQVTSATLGLGEDVTCTFVNDDDAPSLTLTKIVVNDNGGTAVATDFTLTADGPTPISGAGGAASDATFSAGSYSLSETSVAGYTASSWVCTGGTQVDDVISLALGESASCEITNDDDAPSLTLTKIVVNDNGGTAVATDFTLTADGPTPISGAGGAASDATFSAGTYDLSETSVAGYTASDWSCTGGIQNGASIALGLGESASCEITNDDDAPSLTLTKIVVNDNGGTAVATDFTLTADGPTPISGAGGAASDTTFSAGSYSLSETSVAGYTASSWVCTGGTQVDDAINLALGESASCEITNDDDAPSLTLTKIVVNDNGGTAVATDFTLTADGPTPISGAGGAASDATFSAGSYSLSETSVAGYTASSWVCTGGTQVDDAINLALGESASCEITNDDDAPSLTLIKEVINNNGGTNVAADWTLTADGPTPISGAGGATSDATFSAGSYDLGETGPTGYTASDWSCTGGTQTAASISLELGESATCTIVNDDNGPGLTLTKIVVNDNGGTNVATDWTLTADGPTPISGAGGAASDDTFEAGTYALSETGPGGYTATAWECTGGTQNGAEITLELGESASCVITNDDDVPSLTLVKEVVNDNGGTSVAAAWTLTADGPTPISGAGGATSDATFSAGSYDLGETGPGGYTASDWVCVGGSQTGASIALGLGESATCTIVNDDDAPSLTLVKEVVNDNGGTAVAAAWTLTADGPTPISGAGGATSDATFSAGSYDLGETGPGGYTAGDWNCVGGSQTGASIALGLGESATCTIVNDDDAPSLTLVKEVVNDNGGTNVAADWTLTADGPTPISGAGGAASDATFSAGTYGLSETGPGGYTASDWVCVGGSQTDSSISLELGESATCTIVNDDDAPSLTLIKEVINNNGGTNVAADWTLTADGPTPISGAGGATSDATFSAGSYDLGETGPTDYTASNWSCTGGTQTGASISLDLGESATCTIVNDDDGPGLTLTKIVVNDNGGTAVATDFVLTADGPTPVSGAGSAASDDTFEAGTYALSETGPGGYTASDWDCTGGTQNGAEITLELGEAASCVITNDDDVPSLTLVKEVTNDNGGTAEATAWTLTADGPTPISGAGGATSDATFSAGSYDLGETGPGGYTAGDWNCVGGTQTADSIALDLGESATCTIVNDDDAPSLILVKEVTNDNGGTAEATAWTLTADGPTPISGAGGATSDATFSAGGYALSETGPAGYTGSDWVCVGGTQSAASITLDLGESATCTIVNDDDAPSLTLVKEVVNDDGGNSVAAEWTLTADGPTPISGAGGATSDATFSAGTYDLTETGVDGYLLASLTCSNADGELTSVTIGLGEQVTCTFVNDDEPVDLELTKDDDGFEAIAGGDPIPYTITVQNIGTRDADLGEPVTVTDELPAFLSWNTFPANCSAVGQVLTCDIDPALMTAGGAAVTIDVLVDVAPDAPSGDFENRAWVTTEDDPVCVGVDCVPPPCEQAAGNNNVDCEDTPVDRFATIMIVKTDDVADGDAVEPGDEYGYTLVVTNNGPSSILPGLVVDDDLPAQLAFVSVDGGSDWSCNDADPIECTYGPGLAPGETAPTIAVTVLVLADASGEFIENVAVAIGAVDRDCPPADGLIEGHVVLACNQVMDDDDEVTPLQPSADLAIIKTASVSQIGAGGGFNWILDITNNGPGTAFVVTVGDIVPSVFVVTGVTSSEFDCSNTGNAVTCTKASMAVDETGQVVITVTVPADAADGTVTNVGTVESETPDTDLTNNSDDASVIIVAQAAVTTTLPPVTLPKTGSDASGGLVQGAFVLILLGGVVVLATRRRREDELTTTA